MFFLFRWINYARDLTILMLGLSILLFASKLGCAEDIPSVPTSVTLASLLQQTQAAKQNTILAVAAETIHIPTGIDAPRGERSLSQIASLFGCVTHDFGNVTSIGPATMVVLNTQPNNPDPYDGIPPDAALKNLLASLDTEQWSKLTTAAGIGYPDLHDNWQRHLFQALFPGGSLTFIDRLAMSGSGSRHVIESDELLNARLRLGQKLTMSLPSISRPGEFTGHHPVDAENGTQFEAIQTPSSPFNSHDLLYGVRIRAEIPNSEKPGSLDFSNSVMDAEVHLKDVKTVRDLIYAIGLATQLELYADERYGGRPVSIFGANEKARAGDLLRALAYSVTGTYRKVGATYVLTDDLIGIGTRRQTIARFASQAFELRRGLLDTAADNIVKTHTIDALVDLSGAASFNKEQQDQAAKDNRPPGTALRLFVPYSQLTDAQKKVAQRLLDEDQANANKRRRQSDESLNGKIWLQSLPVLQLLLPGQAAPINLDSYLGTVGIFSPSESLFSSSMQGQGSKPDESAKIKSVSLKEAFRLTPRRALLAHIHKPSQIDPLLAAMKQAGYTELWLDVFSSGVAHVGGSSLSRSDPLIQGKDILDDTLRVAKKQGIKVYAVFDLLNWGETPKESLRDVTLLGENLKRPDHENINVAINPTDSTVQNLLTSLVKNVAKRHGLAGMIWRGTMLPGYDFVKGETFTRRFENLGYSETARLAFLRAEHADPLDLDADVKDSHIDTADYQVPGFDDFAIESSINDKWNSFRSQWLESILQQFYISTSEVRPDQFELMVQQRRYDSTVSWFGLWDKPKAKLPAAPPDLAYAGLDRAAKYAKSISSVAIAQIPNLAVRNPQYLANNIALIMQGSNWDGIAIDASKYADTDLLTFIKSTK